MTTSMGRLERDTVWAGDVVVSGDVLVPAGTTLRIAAGTRVRFAERPHWACSVFWRSATSDSVEATMRDLCDVVVLGRLEIDGTPDEPVRLGEASRRWGGITCLEDGSADLRHAVLAGTPHFAVQALDDAVVRGDGSECGDGEFGLWGWGTSRLFWRGGKLGASRASVICCEGSHAHLVGVEDASSEGVAAMDWAVVRAEDVRFAAPRKHCVVARQRSWVKLRSCRGAAGAPADVVRLDDACVEVSA